MITLVLNFEQYFQEGKSENMPRLPVPGSDMGSWGDILNEFLNVSHASDGTLKPNSVAGSQVQSGSITQSKLNTANSPASGQVLSYDGSGMSWVAPGSAPVSSVAGKTGAVTLDKADVSLGNVDNTSDANKPISTATQSALDAKAGTSHDHAISDVTNLQSTLANKADQSIVITAGTGLSGGGDLSASRTLNVADDSTTQKIEVAKNGTLQGTRKQINFIAGSNASVDVADNNTDNRIDVTINAGDSNGVVNAPGGLTAGTNLLVADIGASNVSVQGAAPTGTYGPAIALTSFSAATGWTVNGDGLSATHTNGGGTTPITANLAQPVVAGTVYRITFNTATSATVAPSIGDSVGDNGFFAGNQTQYLAARTTTALKFIPDTAYNGTISAVTIEPRITNPAVFTFRHSDNSAAVEVRPGGATRNNTLIGVNAGATVSTLTNNTALGHSALKSQVQGGSSTAIGYNALANASNSFRNTAVGVEAMGNATVGSNNTSVGTDSLKNNTIGGSNTAAGEASLQNNTSGGSNSAFGASSLSGNTTGSYNVGIGLGALISNTSGVENVGVGYSALSGSSTGTGNTGLGTIAVSRNTTGSNNTGLGYYAFSRDGSGATATTWYSGQTLSNASAVGALSQVQVSNGLVLGRGGSAS